MNKPFIVVNANGEEVHRYASAAMANAYIQNHSDCSIRIVLQRRVY